MIDYKLLINGEDVTSFLALPSKEQYVLDSALDNGVLTLPNTTISTIYKPYTPISIIKNNKAVNMYIISDKVTKIIGTDTYRHDLVLIEETKLLEKKVVDTNTTTQPLVHNYDMESGRVYVTSTISSRGGGVPSETKYYYNSVFKPLTPITTNQLPSCEKIFEQDSVHNLTIAQLAGSLTSVSITLKDEYDNIIQQFNGLGGNYDTPFNLDRPLQSRIYKIEYKIEGFSLGYNIVTNSFEFWGYNQQQPRLKKTITDVVNRLLAITETLRESESPALVFNQEQADFYNQRDANGEPLYPAPEFSMTKSTLRECLDQVGGYIHSIVRLVGNTIYFDKLGGNKETKLDEDFIGYYETLDGEQYASQLDTIVSNLTNIDDAQTGVINEPFMYGFKTVRAESIGVKITDTNAIIESTFPIEKIHKLYCGWITPTGSQDAVYVGDITPYVYEKAEYDLLSSIGGTFPLSKGYAITYTQGEKNITGLTFKLENAVSPVFEYPAILNIISQKIGRKVQSLFNVQNIADLQFWLIYYPSTTARVEQARTDINNYSMELTSIYNQSANKVDSRAYGENLKGTIARLGNIEKFITFVKTYKEWKVRNIPFDLDDLEVNVRFVSNNRTFEKFSIRGNRIYYDNVRVYYLSFWSAEEYKQIEFCSEIPKKLYNWLKKNATLKETNVNVGDFVNIDNQDYYIASLNIENQLDHIKYTVGLSKDFNALSKYIGIKNNIRLYEVSEKQSVERYIIRHDYCVIGKPAESDFKEMLTDDAKTSIMTQFGEGGITLGAISVAEVQGIDVDGDEKKKLILPVISLAMGNSLWFGFKFADNYSAGNQSVQGNGSGSYFKLNAPVGYTDYFGEIEKLKLRLLPQVQPIRNKQMAISVGDALPLETLTPYNNVYVDTNGDNLIVKKDNREQLNIAYMLHYVTNDDIIIGSDMLQTSGLVGGSVRNCKLYILPNRINKFDREIDLSRATLVHEYGGSASITYDSTTNQLIFANKEATSDGKSWVIVGNGNKLMFGKNIAITSGDTIELPTITFTHKII